MRKTNITDLIRIYSTCHAEKRDEETTKEQIQGAIFANCRDEESARLAGAHAYEVIREYFPLIGQRRKRVATTLLARHDDVLTSTGRVL